MSSSKLQLDAEVIATFGRRAEVRDASGAVHEARPFGRRISVVCGDRVRCRHDPGHDELHIVEVLPRSTALHRTTGRGDAEAVVANITHVVTVLAPLPAPDLYVIDRYLCAAASAHIESVIVVNKTDLGIEPELEQEIEAWAELGIPVIRCASNDAESVARLAASLRATTAVLVGQSGVGKSSLIRAMVPTADIAVGSLVRTTEEGRHTTTASRLYDLPRGGRLIDSPGVRDFAPAIDHLDAATLGFIEVARRAPECRFLDCRHMREPECAIRTAAETGDISPRRYESYRRLRRLYDELTEKRGYRK